MKKHFLFSIAGLLTLLVLLNACKKNDNNSTPQSASVMLVNASPGDSVGYDFYFNDSKITSQAYAYPTNSNYISVTPKGYTVKVARSNSITELASGSFNFSGGSSYSVFAYDTLLNGKVKVFALPDDLTPPAAGKAKVRFFHLSPVNLAVDILANDSVVFANRSYADIVSDNSKGNFISVKAGTYSVKVRLAGSSLAPLITVDNVNFADGKIYTVFAKGTVSGKGVNALGAQIISNN